MIHLTGNKFDFSVTSPEEFLPHQLVRLSQVNWTGPWVCSSISGTIDGSRVNASYSRSRLSPMTHRRCHCSQSFNYVIVASHTNSTTQFIHCYALLLRLNKLEASYTNFYSHLRWVQFSSFIFLAYRKKRHRKKVKRKYSKYLKTTDRPYTRCSSCCVGPRLAKNNRTVLVITDA